MRKQGLARVRQMFQRVTGVDNVETFILETRVFEAMRPVLDALLRWAARNRLAL